MIVKIQATNLSSRRILAKSSVDEYASPLCRTPMPDNLAETPLSERVKGVRKGSTRARNEGTWQRRGQRPLLCRGGG